MKRIILQVKLAMSTRTTKLLDLTTKNKYERMRTRVACPQSPFTVLLLPHRELIQIVRNNLNNRKIEPDYCFILPLRINNGLFLIWRGL